MSKYKLFILFILLFNIGFAQDIVINEIMSSNGSGIADDFGEYSDWVEIYNNSPQALNIYQWYLSDDENEISKWQFPDTTILPNDFLLVFCSGRDTISSYFHSNFKLKSSGETLILCDENESIIDQFDPVYLDNNISFGRKADGGTDKGFFYISSPGYSNNNNIELNEISFSHDAGFYTSGFDLSMAMENTGGQIYYTANGNEPHPDSSYTVLYEGAVPLSGFQNNQAVYSYIPTTPADNSYYFEWETPDGNVENHTIIRARVFQENQPQCNVFTNTYFVGDDIGERFTLPILSIIADSISLFGYDTGIYVPGKRHIQGVVKSGNYMERGEAWEKKATIEYFSETGDKLFEQDLGIRIHGNLSRAAPQKGFQFFPRSIYDGNEKMDFPFFEGRSFQDYKRIISRSIYSAHANSVIRDEIVQDFAKNLNVFYQAWQPVITFVNGEFWGIQDLREKQNEFYLEQHFDIDPDSVDIIDAWGIVDAGDDIEHSEFIYYTDNTDFSIPENYETVKTMIDIPAYIDYYITEIFFVNKDWPGNNYKKWREKGEDNKWRWFLFDLDATMKYVSHNSLRRAAGDTLESINPEWSTKLFKALLQNEEFSNQFLSRFVYVLNNDFRHDNTIAILDNWEAMVENEIGNTILRWGIIDDMQAWRESIEDIRQFLRLRSCYVKNHLEEYFGADDLDIPCWSDLPEGVFNDVISVFPNPTKNSINISSPNEIYSWTIFDMTGEMVLERKACNQYTERINVSALGKGFYFLIINTGENSQINKIIKY